MDQLSVLRASFLNPQSQTLYSQVSIKEFIDQDDLVKKIINEPLSIQSKAKRVEKFNHSNDSSHSNVELFESPMTEIDLATTYKEESKGFSQKISIRDLSQDDLLSDSD